MPETNTRFFEEITLPTDGEWARLDQVPEDLLELMSLYRSALEDGDEAYEHGFETIDDFYEVYDAFEGNRCFVAGTVEDGEKTINTIANYRENRDGTVFGEGIATAKNARGQGMAKFALSKILGVARQDGADSIVVRSQPRTAALWAHLGATPLDRSKYPLMSFSTKE